MRKLKKPESATDENTSEEPTGKGLPVAKTEIHNHAGSTGSVVTVTWGRELVSPKPFHTYEVGPFSLEVTLRPGELVDVAMERGYALLDAFATKVRDEKRAAFAEFLKSK